MIDISTYLKKSEIIEQKIIKSLKNAQTATQYENQNLGFDFSLNLTFDIKTAKKIRRSDKNVNYQHTWIEYRNVYGNNGSLLKETLDYFLCENETTWNIYSRIDLLNLFLQKCRNSDGSPKNLVDLTSNIYPELYTPYRRTGRKDVIMLINYGDVLALGKIPKEHLTLASDNILI